MKDHEGFTPGEKHEMIPCPALPHYICQDANCGVDHSNCQKQKIFIDGDFNNSYESRVKKSKGDKQGYYTLLAENERLKKENEALKLEKSFFQRRFNDAVNVDYGSVMIRAGEENGNKFMEIQKMKSHLENALIINENLSTEISRLQEQNGEQKEVIRLLTEALKRARERIEYDNYNHKSEYCISVLKQIQLAIKAESLLSKPK